MDFFLALFVYVFVAHFIEWRDPLLPSYYYIVALGLLS